MSSISACGVRPLNKPSSSEVEESEASASTASSSSSSSSLSLKSLSASSASAPKISAKFFPATESSSTSSTVGESCASAHVLGTSFAPCSVSSSWWPCAMRRRALDALALCRRSASSSRFFSWRASKASATLSLGAKERRMPSYSVQMCQTSGLAFCKRITSSSSETAAANKPPPIDGGWQLCSRIFKITPKTPVSSMWKRYMWSSALVIAFTSRMGASCKYLCPEAAATTRAFCAKLFFLMRASGRCPWLATAKASNSQMVCMAKQPELLNREVSASASMSVRSISGLAMNSSTP
mmetsp:Transcript_72184/g.114440  ORF Transcript_72184/g.114440 Transcript_72184/m.114440 type:complete len:296 (+) Transcript_72184:535-1422(+)